MTTNPSTPGAGDPGPEPPAPVRAVTYHQAQTGYRCTTDARERSGELTSRDLMARAHARLAARGTFDPQVHGDPAKYPPLTVTEHLELLAAGEMLARYYRHPAFVHQAVLAGASWPQIAEATGTDQAAARQAYRDWAGHQHRLYLDYDGGFGLNDTGHAAALHRAADPLAEPPTGREAGQ